MKKRTLHGKAWLAGVALLSACTGVPVQLGPAIAVKYDATKPRQVSAEACGFQLLLLIPIATNARAERAYAALKAQAGEDYIADLKVTERWTYAFVGTIYCTAMEATAYPTIGGPGSAQTGERFRPTPLQDLPVPR